MPNGVDGSISDSSSGTTSTIRPLGERAPPKVTLPVKKNASVACDQCRLAKRKCDQLIPCSNCRNNQKNCTYNPANDGRRKDVRKRRIDELEFRSNALGKLLTKIRRSTQPDAQELIDLIKRDASIEEILAFIDEHPGEIANEVRRSLSTSPIPTPGSGIRKVLAISDLIDNPTVRVSVGPWTKVTSDDNFVSNVLSAYLNWYHYYYHNIDWTAFIEAYRKNDLDSPYCTPFLVNAVLAMGCFWSDHPSVFAIAGDPSTRGMHFYHEAEQLYNAEGDNPTLANVQGLTILMMVVSFAGKDKAVALYLKKLETLLPEMLESYGAYESGSSHTNEFQRSLQITEWAAYTYKCGFALGFRTPLASTKPVISRPYTGQQWSSFVTDWSPYPLNQDAVGLKQQALYDKLLDVYVFMEETIHLLSNTFPTLGAFQKIDAAQNLDDRIHVWCASLDPEYSLGGHPFVVAPAVIDLHLTLLLIRLTFWNSAIAPIDASESTPSDTDQSDTVSSQSRSADDVPSDGMRRRLVSKCLSFVEQVASLILKSNERFGPTLHTVLTPQTGIYCAMFLLNGHLYGAHEEELLLQIMQILVQCANKNTLVKGVTQMLLKVAEGKVNAQSSDAANLENAEPPTTPHGEILPKMFKSLELIVKDIEWSPSDHLHFSSRYPNYLEKKVDETTELSHLLEKWADLAIDEKNSKNTSDASRTAFDANAEESEYESKDGTLAPSIERDW